MPTSAEGHPTGQAWELPVLNGTIGPDVIDIRKLYTDTGYFTYDPGYTSTGSLRVHDHLHRRRGRHPAASRLSRSRNWPRTADFMEVCYLLLNGELPNAEQKTHVREGHHLPHDGA